MEEKMVLVTEFKKTHVALGVDELRALGCISHLSEVLVMFNSKGEKSLDLVAFANFPM